MVNHQLVLMIWVDKLEFWLASSAEIGLHAVNNITMQKWNLSRHATCMSSTLPCEHIQSSKWDFDQQQPWMAVI